MLESAAVFALGGFLFGAVYDLFRFFRLLFKNKACSFILDLLFFALFALVFFTLLLAYNDGIVRALYFTAYFVGLLLYLFTAFRLTARFQRRCADCARRICKKNGAFAKKLLQLPQRLYYNGLVLRKKPLRKKSKPAPAAVKGDEIGKANFGVFHRRGKK